MDAKCAQCGPAITGGTGSAGVWQCLGAWGLSFEMNGLLLSAKGRAKSLLLSTALSLIAAPAIAQIAPMGVVPVSLPPSARPPAAVAKVSRPASNAPRTTPEGAVPGNPDYAPDQQEPAAATPVPP